MFLGKYSHTLDDKGRLTLPAKFRDQLSKGVVVTLGLDGCLFVFPYEEFRRFTESLSERLSFTQQMARKFSRLLFSQAVDAIPDKQGRILVPPYLRDYANLESDVTITGANNRLELWNPERWEETRLDVESNAEMIAEQFSTITY